MVASVLTLVAKPGCHLCDDARAVIRSVLADLGDEAEPVTVVERSIFDDDELRERFADEIPVVLIDDKVHTYWRVDPVRLRAALGGTR